MANSRSSSILARVAIVFAAAGLFCLLRADLTAMAWNGYVIAGTRRYTSSSLIRDYLKHHDVPKLQLGAGGSNKQGWLNTDIEPQAGQAYLDASQPFPLPDRTFRYVFSEHVIEHITYEQGTLMLKESYRVLQPGGKVRVATPNLVKFVELFRSGKAPETLKYMQAKHDWHQWPVTADPECYILNLQLREWGHRFVYTPKMLRSSLEAAGFRDIRELRPGESDDPALKDIELRPRSNERDINAYETMVFEATRPGEPVS